MFSEKKITVCNKADYYRCRNRKIHMIQLMPHRVLITVIFWYRNEDLPFNGSNTGFPQIGGLQISVSECMKNRGFFFLIFKSFFCISFTVILSKMWNIRVKSMIWRPFPLIIRAIQIFHSSLSFVKRKLRPIVYQSHSQCIIVTFQEAFSFANILWRFDNKKIPEKCSFIFL